MDWRDDLQALLREGGHRTQTELAGALVRRTGLQLNQATISRELNRLGARKVAGEYRLPNNGLGGGAPGVGLGGRIVDVKVTAGGCLVVVHSEPAFASLIGKAIDSARLSGVVGTLAGDDAVFVATTGPEALTPLYALLGWTGEARRSA